MGTRRVEAQRKPATPVKARRAFSQPSAGQSIAFDAKKHTLRFAFVRLWSSGLGWHVRKRSVDHEPPPAITVPTSGNTWLSCKVSVVAAAGVDCRFDKVGLGVGGAAVNTWLEVVFDLAMIIG
jgi:hypothetical protein